NITGAFLNSDDTGLTTNVFLNEPRLFGLRVTKQWTGQPWWLSGDSNHPAGQPYPLTVEIGGQIQRQDAPNTAIAPSFVSAFPTSFHPLDVQNRDLDWGDGREVKVTYRPGGQWFLAAEARFGVTNGTNRSNDRHDMPRFCEMVDTPLEPRCPTFGDANNWYASPSQYANATIEGREDHAIVDFMVGNDVAFGAVLPASSVTFGLRYAKFTSDMDMNLSGIPVWNFAAYRPGIKYETHDQDAADVSARRRFQGAGPQGQWEASARLLGSQSDHLDLTGAAGGAVLFGRQKTDISGQEVEQYFHEKYFQLSPRAIPTTTTTPISFHREKSAVVPSLNLSAGLSWEVDRFKVGAGYRWERYFNAIDGGYAGHKSEDRTIDGPYFKIAVGFGG
ncbi:MAG TPA: Lpg1974 family pore-forming outer membrane protein, partial [Isosphaeraceae bacterium]|nr:Lpg1974 family pore-forming outer membrane protein [Isosphaeraceae bacterium]